MKHLVPFTAMVGAENPGVGRHETKRPLSVMDKQHGARSHPKVHEGLYFWFSVAMVLSLAGAIERKWCHW